MTASEVCLALVRTTLATAAAACVAALLLGWLDVRSPRVHRLVWLLVVLQGWLLVPWTLELATLPSPERVLPGGMSSSSWTWSESAPTWPLPKPAEALAPTPTWSVADATRLAVLTWLVGGAGIALFAAWQYLRIVRTLPLGNAPDEPAWQAEWRRELAATRIRAEFRITDRLGPLVAFVPFVYLVLAPRDLWSVLTSPERRSILRHELAHLHRGDLWKSLAIRVFALPQWFNPFVWRAVRRFDEAAEWACDELAANNRDPLTLANSLLRTAELCKGVASPPRAAGFIPAVPSGRSMLSRRIHRLVTPRFKEESTMRKLTVPTLLAALAVLQLVRIERVAAGDPAEPPLAAIEETTRFTDEGTVTLSAEADAAARVAEFEEIAECPYVIEPPDVLNISLRVPGRFTLHGEDSAVSTEAMTLQHLVAMDGRVNLFGEFGTVFVAGLTVDEAREAVERQLADRFEDAEVDVAVHSSNSKVCYVIDQRGKLGNVVRMPVPFPLTVDFNVGAALAHTEPRDFDLAAARIWVARPAVEGVGSELALPVAWDAATDAPAPETNHPLLPGDRVFVEAPKSAGPPTIAPHDELAVTFSRTDGERLEFTNLDELRGAPGASVSASMDSLTLYVPVDGDGCVDFKAWFKSGAIEVVGKTFDEAAQAIHDGVLGPQDRDFTIAVALRQLPAEPPKHAAAVAPAAEALPEALSPELPATAARPAKLMRREAPPLPSTTAKDPGPDAVVTLVLRLAKDHKIGKLITITGPTTLGDLLASTTFPEPIDFAAAMITLTRPCPPVDHGAQIEVAVGWDQGAQRPEADSDYGLEDGDTVTIDLAGPPPGAEVHPEPVFSFSLGFGRNDVRRRAAPTAAPKPHKAKPAAKPQAAAEGEAARQIEFQFQFVDDASGALADFELPISGGGMTVGESRAVLSALRVFKKHDLIATMAYPVIRTEVGRPASFNLAEPAEGAGEGGADFRVVRAVTVVARPQKDGGGKDGLLVEVRARAGRSEIDMGVAMEVGQTAIVQIPPAEGADDGPDHYIVITPRWVE